MNKHTSRKSSRKASDGRADRVSTKSVSSQATPAELIKLGVDTHAGQYTFARMIDHSGIQPSQSLSPEEFLKFLSKQRQMARRVVMVYEAGPYGYSLYRQAIELGVECLVCAPERLSRRKRVNDKIDARELLSRLDRYLAGNTTALRLVNVPTIEQEMSRRQGRERNVYRKERQRWVARGRSLLHTMGIARPGRWWDMKVHQSLMQRIEERYGPSVAKQTAAELEGMLQMLEPIEKKLEELTKTLCEQAKKKRQSKSRGSSASRIKGIGDLSEELLDREIGDWNRFANRRQIASYTGLCPGEDSSGDSQRSLSIDKHGNPRVRAVLVELAWLLPRFQPRYYRLRRWKKIFSGSGKTMKKKAAVALARQLAVDLWRIKTGRVQPEELGLELLAA